MIKQGRVLVVFAVILGVLSSCASDVWTGANLIYNRHSFYKKVNDYRLMIEVNNAVFADKAFKERGCNLDLAVFNKDVLLVGHVPTEFLLDKLKHRLTRIKGYRRLFNKVIVSQPLSGTGEDSWITTKIRSQILSDASVDPNGFKIITLDRIVYLMGDVTKDDGIKIINIARHTLGVERVVKLLKYYVYQEKNNG